MNKTPKKPISTPLAPYTYTKTDVQRKCKLTYLTLIENISKFHSPLLAGNIFFEHPFPTFFRTEFWLINP
jgi:hypothetical protein